jgi:O-antigen ligase
MKARFEHFYRLLADRKAHALLIYVTAATILLVSIGGIVSSTTIGLLVVLGILTLAFDANVRGALLDPKKLMPLMILMGGVLVWQCLGIAFRTPTDKQAATVLGSAIGIAMLLPLLLAAQQRDPQFRGRLFGALFVLGCIAAAISLASYAIILGQDGRFSIKELLGERLVPIGRANHQILGAGGLAACFFAGLAIYPKVTLRRKRLIVAGLLLIAITVALTQSRGPILAIGLALVATSILELFRIPATRVTAGLVLAVLCFAIPVVFVLAEPWLKAWACTTHISLCRPSNRQDVWGLVSEMIQERLWFGIGPSFRFPGGAVSHPHNGILGLTFYFGLPMAFLLLGIIAFAVKQAAAAPSSPSRTFALLGIFFSMSFVATDLSNPFAFVNTLYLYLWLPVWIGALLVLAPHDDAPVAASPGNSLTPST